MTNENQLAAEPMLTLRLFVSGSSTNSLRAIANLESLRREIGADWELEVVDILDEPRRAIAEGILVTPTLVKLSPPPSRRLIGNLSERQVLTLALGLGGTSTGSGPATP